MRKTVIYPVITLVAATLLVAPVAAQTNGDTVEPNQGQTEPGQAASTLEERQAERKQRFATALTNKQAERLSNRCQAAQQVITNISTRISQVKDARSNRYDALTARLESLSGRLSEQVIDTTNLDASIEETQSLIDVFTSLMDEHAVTINDAVEIECKDSPSDFKVVLEDARLQRQELIAAAAAIKTHIKDSLKTELQNIRTVLQAEDDSNSDPDTPVSNEEPVTNE